MNKIAVQVINNVYDEKVEVRWFYSFEHANKLKVCSQIQSFLLINSYRFPKAQLTWITIFSIQITFLKTTDARNQNDPIRVPFQKVSKFHTQILCFHFLKKFNKIIKKICLWNLLTFNNFIFFWKMWQNRKWVLKFSRSLLFNSYQVPTTLFPFQLL